ncbi:MAG: hypothetical protein NVS3B3_05200 [Aquirhabdus sp.]
MFNANNQYQIQYLGSDGITQFCLTVITNLLQTHSDFDSALLLTCDTQHAFIVKDQFENHYVIKSGFGSGYHGEGSKGLAKAIYLFQKHQINIEEIIVSPKVIQRLNQARLSDQDIDNILSKPFVRPIRLADYTYPFKSELSNLENIKQLYPQEIPYSILDERLFDLALLFKSDPDASLSKAYKRLEDIVRTRTRIQENGNRLYSQAFNNDDSPLSWSVPDKSEIKGRAKIFIGTYEAFRNARAHRENTQDTAQMLREFLLINELYILESEATANS